MGTGAGGHISGHATISIAVKEGAEEFGDLYLSAAYQTP